MKLITWNVNGLRAVAKKGFIEWFAAEQPDILCLQETKSEPEQLGFDLRQPAGYNAYFSFCTRKKGYSGVVTYTKEKPIAQGEGMGIEKFDEEGRIVWTEFKNFILFNIYFPNGKASTERLFYKMEFYEAFLKHIEKLRAGGKKIIFCGDVNTAHHPIDLARPKENEDISGFLPIEREWMDRMVSKGYIDAFREFHPEPNQYSWWSQRSGARERNVGWRIDYFFIQPELRKNLKDSYHLPNVMGSDHCPVVAIFDF